MTSPPVVSWRWPLAGGFDPARIYLHGNAKSIAELEFALESGVGHIVLDSLHDVERLEAVAQARGGGPGCPDSGHSRRLRGNARRDLNRSGRFEVRFGMGEAPGAIDRIAGSPHLRLVGLHCHIGSQLLALEPFIRAVMALSRLGDFDVYNLGGGLGIAYLEAQEPPSIADYVATLSGAAVNRIRSRQADSDRARTLAGCQLNGHALYGRDRETQRLDLGRGQRRHVRQPQTDAVRLPLRGRGSQPDAGERR